MCFLCGDPECVIRLWDPDGNEISLDEWVKISHRIHGKHKGGVDILHVGETVMDHPAVTILTGWSGVSKEEEPPEVWQTIVLAREVPGMPGLKITVEMGGHEKTLDVEPKMIRRDTYATREAALAGHDSMVANIRNMWSELHDEYGVPEQLSLVDGELDLSHLEFDLEMPDLRTLLNHDDPPE